MAIDGCLRVQDPAQVRAGTYRAAIPPRIGSLELRQPGELSAESADALREIVRFDEYASQRLGSARPPNWNR